MTGELIKTRFSVECVACLGLSRTDPCEHCGRPNPEGTLVEVGNLSALKIKAARVVNAIGAGYRLRIPKDPSEASRIVWRWKTGRDVETYRAAEFEVEPDVARFCIDHRPLFLMTERDENSRTGWKSAGFDGEQADFYCLIY